MKPKEIIYKSAIVNGVNARNQDYFLDLMMTELKNTYKAFAKRRFRATLYRVRKGNKG